jgi:hypothetical protein
MIGEPATAMELRCKNADGDRAVTNPKTSLQPEIPVSIYLSASAR